MTEKPAAPRRLRRWRATALCLILVLAAAGLHFLSPPWHARWQERGFDTMIRLTPAPDRSDGPPVLVVDIGSTDEKGNNWDRTSSARLAAAVAKAGPAVVAWDIVFAGNCDATTPNIALTAGLQRGPTVLGFLLSAGGSPTPTPKTGAIAVADGVMQGLWSAPVAEMPCPAFAVAAIGLGSISLPGDANARVRMVPAAVMAAGSVWPSLPVDALRLALDLHTPLITAQNLHLGDKQFPLGQAATLRFRPSDLAARTGRTLSAADVLAGQGADRMAGAVVFVGSSLAARGGLRPTAADPLYPSVQIAADLADGLLAGSLPWRSDRAPVLEAATLVIAGAVAATFVALWSPLAAFGGTLVLAGLWVIGTAGIYRATGHLADPMLPPLALTMAITAGLLLQAAKTFRAERALRGRMGQLLPGAVVSRLIDEPNLLRLKGERRIVTALFTDLEGFSTLTNSLEPEELIAILDRYFTTVSAIVLRQGGMIDKIVGDAVHALFNAPLDQPGHVDAAIAAAADIVAETEALRATLNVGRTRVGVETGPAILGDVGSGDRIDYTAHGASVNLAARLQEMGKTLGPPVIIGPSAAAMATTPLRPLGEAEIRSFGRMQLFTLP